MSRARFARTGFAPSIAWGTPQRHMQRCRCHEPQRDMRCNDDQTTIGANDAPVSSVLNDLRNQRPGDSIGLLQEFEEPMQGHIKDPNASLSGNFQLQGMQQLSQNEGSNELLFEQNRGGRPPQTQTQFGFEQLEGQLNVPATRIQFGDLVQGQHLWITDLAQIAVELPPRAKLNQAHQVSGPIRAMGSQPDQRIEQLCVLVKDMRDLIGRSFSPTRHPVVALLGQIIKPGEAEIPQIGQNETASRKPFQQKQHPHFAVGPALLAPLQAKPLLGSQVKEPGNLPCQQAWAAQGILAQILTQAAQAFQSAFIQSDDLPGKGGQMLRQGTAQGPTGAQAAVDALQEGLESLRSLCQQALTNGIVGQVHGSKRTQMLPEQDIPEVGHMLDLHQDALQKGQTELLARHFAGIASSRCLLFIVVWDQQLTEQGQQWRGPGARRRGGQLHRWGMIHHRKLLLSRIGFRNTRSQKSFLFFSSVGKSILNLIETNGASPTPTDEHESKKENRDENVCKRRNKACLILHLSVTIQKPSKKRHA